MTSWRQKIIGPSDDWLTNVSTRYKGFTCSFCSKVLPGKRDFASHILGCTGGWPATTLPRFKLFDTQCSFCRKVFPGKASLESYLRIHTGEKPFNCSFCGRSFRRNDHVELHGRIHTGEKPYECQICGKAFSDPSAARKHTKLKFYVTLFTYHLNSIFQVSGSLDIWPAISTHIKVCPFCKKPFCGKSALEIHLRTHTGEKPFKCSFCGKAFSRKQHVTLHERIHTGEKPYKCDICGKAFTDSSNKRAHLAKCLQQSLFTNRSAFYELKLMMPLSFYFQIFDPGSISHSSPIALPRNAVACPICTKLFMNKKALEGHYRTHTGDKPFTCSYCGKGFSWKNHWKTHERIHTGEKPYKCQICGRSFADSSAFRRHKLMHMKLT
ncbi:zinc finger protein 253-like [Lineus longissimus]|uniref:zinc finger protein 253-like n=1 Tax=Lineus longissimus TaxID=88925 RepID=UPI00315D2D67